MWKKQTLSIFIRSTVVKHFISEVLRFVAISYKNIFLNVIQHLEVRHNHTD